MQKRPGAEKPARFFGKYRGTVTGNMDPLGQGRLQVAVLDVAGVGAPVFAMPCVAYPDLLSGAAIPPVGARVWVEFEAGDPGLPIWSGCFAGPGQVIGKTEGH